MSAILNGATVKSVKLGSTEIKSVKLGNVTVWNGSVVVHQIALDVSALSVRDRALFEYAVARVVGGASPTIYVRATVADKEYCVGDGYADYTVLQYADGILYFPNNELLPGKIKVGDTVSFSVGIPKEAHSCEAGESVTVAKPWVPGGSLSLKTSNQITAMVVGSTGICHVFIALSNGGHTYNNVINNKAIEGETSVTVSADKGITTCVYNAAAYTMSFTLAVTSVK